MKAKNKRTIIIIINEEEEEDKDKDKDEDESITPTSVLYFGILSLGQYQHQCTSSRCQRIFLTVDSKILSLDSIIF